ncbi:U4/U6 small nuclear ribonucleoprotein prp4, variant 2 [Stygiomarasmius scandens]
MELEMPPSPPPVEEALASRRARRQAILAKYAGLASAGVSPSPASGLSSAVQEPPPSATSDQLSHPPSNTMEHAANGDNGNKHASMSPSPSPGDDFALAKADDEKSSELKKQQENTAGEQISAADYDPSLDRREDEQRRINAPVRPEPDEVEEIEVEEKEEEEEEEDDLDDMFAVTDAPKKPKKVKKVSKAMKPAAPALITTTLDSAADPEGYYNVILGEQLDGGRYQVFSSLGKGMFANVVRARVLQPEPGEQQGKEVAIKIVRCQESMYKAGLKEVQMLNKLKQADPEDKKHIVRMERSFEHRGHLCIVFESMSMNLREVVKRFGKDVGLNIRAVRAYAHQLFLALSLLKKVGVMHADIKPDNILVNEQKTVLKLCDLGSASDATENDITPYLVSRFYRAPEIILGYPYDPALDIWSIGCTLYELYTGKILFPGRSNNQMLLLMMELKGRFNSKMIKKAKFGNDYFDEMGGFNSVEKDRVLGNDVVKKVHISKPSRDLRARLLPPTSVKMKEDENKLLMSFIDLLDKCLALDPARRITPKEALTHPFIRG